MNWTALQAQATADARRRARKAATKIVRPVKHAANYATARAILIEANKNDLVAMRYTNTYKTVRTIKVCWMWRADRPEVATIHASLKALADYAHTAPGDGYPGTIYGWYLK